MSTVDKNMTIDNAEELLEVIAKTPMWEMPKQINQYCDMLQEAYHSIYQAQKALQAEGVLTCAAGEKATKASNDILKAINDHQEQMSQRISIMKNDIDGANEAISEANSIVDQLPGSFLDDVSAQNIMDATKPMDWVVPGLGTLTGLCGVAGLNFVNSLLADNRRKEAEAELHRIQSMMPTGIVAPVPIIDPPYRSSNSDDDEHHDPSDQDTSTQGNPNWTTAGTAGAGAGAAAAAAAAAARSSSGAGSPASSGVRTLPSSNSAANPATAAWLKSHQVPAMPSSQTAAHTGGVASAASTTPGGTFSSRNQDSNAYRDGYIYNSETGRWEPADWHTQGMSVDSGQGGLNGSFRSGALAGGLAAGTGIGGAALAKHVSGAAGSNGLSGSMVGVGGAGAGSLGIGGAGRATGSFYTNTPVTATPVTSSVKGARGMAAGLPDSSATSPAAAKGATRGATPGMMGSQGAGANEKKGKRRGMAYVLPDIEDMEEFEPKPRAAMAGHRKAMD
ncbi:hypothetical protein [Bifidobacterium cuniculi]|uniref:Uncharacterized protein n=1 Tax=Bifidobacterium cuniculi TaxID=1688 RepID=A0A087AYQ1_9BIFI|nr:hypothetical protein [Bifidobacterium cuniculi]KFI63901.1 hypothetical protein BCUN_1513 [Bifidobacterium cuniculi]